MTTTRKSVKATLLALGLALTASIILNGCQDPPVSASHGLSQSSAPANRPPLPPGWSATNALHPGLVRLQPPTSPSPAQIFWLNYARTNSLHESAR